jgi:hypothetical protein
MPALACCWRVQRAFKRCRLWSGGQYTAIGPTVAGNSFRFRRQHMKRSLLLCLGLFTAGHAMAQAAAEPLDLRLPEQPSAYAAESGPSRDAPGTYYGDTSGKPARSGPVGAAVDDDGKARVWGSFTTGIGHTEGHGTSHFNAAEINVSKSFGEGEGRNSINLQINVEQGDGPAFGGHYPQSYYGRDPNYGPPAR